MAKKQITVSDLSDVADETVERFKFSVDLDLTADERQRFLDAVAEYVEANERVHDQRGTIAPSATTTRDREQAKAIRDWGRAHNFDVKDKGKLNDTLVAAYNAAQVGAKVADVEQETPKSSGKREKVAA